MRVLLSNTGRGGELAIFTALVHAYRQACPNAFIRVVTGHNGVYHHMWETNQDIDEWDTYVFRKPHPTGKVYRKPEAAHAEYLKKAEGFDHIENCSEHMLSPDKGKSVPKRTILENIYSRLKHKPFKLAEIERKIRMWPTDEEHDAAERVIAKHGKDLVLISHVAKSASRILNPDGYQQLADKVAKTHPVAFTGSMTDKPLKGHIDLRGTTFRFVYALAQRLNYFMGPDTATTWIATVMPGLLITIRGDKAYPFWNTGLVHGGWREPANTLEMDLVSAFPGSGQHRMSRQIESLVSSLHSRQVQFAD